jgi:two-component system, chemotaxis family, protein-glutamate methylesterase/glutaminase
MANPLRRYDAVVIVASIGGIPALSTLLASLPQDFSIPVFIVQHRSTGRPSLLVSILKRSTALNVREAQEGETPVAGSVYVAPPDHHLLITKSHRLALTDGLRIRHLLSAGDPLFTSAAETYGSGVIAVVLTGTDADGAKGAADVKRAGGTVLVQDKATSEAFAMPAAAIATGCVDLILPITQIGPTLVRLAASPELTAEGAT